MGNIFADIMWEVIELTIEVEVKFLLLEQPGDLGTMARGPYKGQRPASMWQWPQADRIWASPRVRTLALHQGPKPTRLLLIATGDLPAFCYEGPPTFDPDGYYTGPLPLLEGAQGIAKRQSGGPFKTTGTEQWPPRMCQWLSWLLVQSCSATATTANEGGAEPPTVDARACYKTCDAEGPRLHGGEGSPDIVRL